MSKDNPYMSRLSDKLQAQLIGTDKTKPTARQRVLDEATKIVTKDRNSSYGEPEDNFATIAKLWETYLTRRFGLPHLSLEGHDVATLMILVKAARIANDPTNWDNWVDVAGYAAGGAECVQKARGVTAKPDTVMVNNKPLELKEDWSDS